LSLGAAKLSPTQLLRALCGQAGSVETVIFWYTRVPRTAACLLAGCGLAVSGCVIQSVLQNHLASPGIIGVNAGAGLAVNLCFALEILSGWAIAGWAFAGAVGAVALVVLLSEQTSASRTTVILAGVASNSILTALSEAIVTILPEAGMLGSDFRMGGFSSVSHTRLVPATCFILAALAATLTLCGELDVLELGDDTAHSLGLSVKRTRNLFLMLAALMAGASVSFAGLLGFVGLIVPHAARKLVGGNSHILVPFCALSGAGFVTLCDVLSRMLFSPHEIPVGILISIMGGPFFLLLLLKKKGGRVHD
jgi:iron complex transport system permease protein